MHTIFYYRIPCQVFPSPGNSINTDAVTHCYHCVYRLVNYQISMSGAAPTMSHMVSILIVFPSQIAHPPMHPHFSYIHFTNIAVFLCDRESNMLLRPLLVKLSCFYVQLVSGTLWSFQQVIMLLLCVS